MRLSKMARMTRSAVMPNVDIASVGLCHAPRRYRVTQAHTRRNFIIHGAAQPPRQLLVYQCDLLEERVSCGVAAGEETENHSGP